MPQKIKTAAEMAVTCKEFLGASRARGFAAGFSVMRVVRGEGQNSINMAVVSVLHDDCQHTFPVQYAAFKRWCLDDTFKCRCCTLDLPAGPTRELCGRVGCAHCTPHTLAGDVYVKLLAGLCDGAGMAYCGPELNRRPPSLVKFAEGEKFWFKCGKCAHVSEVRLDKITSAGGYKEGCRFCGDRVRQLCPTEQHCLVCLDRSVAGAAPALLGRGIVAVRSEDLTPLDQVRGARIGARGRGGGGGGGD